MRFGTLSDILRRTGANHTTAAAPAFGTKVNDMVGTFNHIKIVLDDDHAFPLVYQASQHLEQAGNICGVQPCGRFVQNIECFASWTLRKLSGKLNALGFPTGEGGCRLAQLDIA